MTNLTPELIQQGLQLCEADREKFALLLLDSLEDLEADEETVRREWCDELQRRWDRYASGEDQLVTHADAMAALRKQAENR